MINLTPVTGKPTEAGLYMRVHTDVRNFSSDFVVASGATLRGLYQKERAQVSSQKDRFYVLDELEYHDDMARYTLQNKIRSLALSPDSAKLKQSIEDYFAYAKKLKAEAASSGSQLTAEAAVDLQNRINTKAVRCRCLTISLIRIEEEETYGLKKNKDTGFYQKEVRFCKVFFPEDTVLSDQLVEKLLDETSSIAIESEVFYEFGKKTIRNAANRKEEIVTVKRAVRSNAGTVLKEQSAKSSITPEIARGSVPDADMSWFDQAMKVMGMDDTPGTVSSGEPDD